MVPAPIQGLGAPLREHVRANREIFLLVPPAVAASGAIAFALSPAWLIQILLLAFLVWQTHHVTKQNLGMFVFWARARGLAGTLRLYQPGSLLDTGMRVGGLF